MATIEADPQPQTSFERDLAETQRYFDSPRFDGVIRLYTASLFLKNIDWYARNGFVEESREALPDRIKVNMIKKLD